jgi:hypothetical protein
MGTPVFSSLPYPMKKKINKHMQHNTVLHCRIKQAAQRYVNRSRVIVKRTINPLGIDSSQDSYDNDPPCSPPQHCCKPSRMAPVQEEPGQHGHRRRYIEDESKDADEDEYEFEGDYEPYRDLGHGHL